MSPFIMRSKRLPDRIGPYVVERELARGGMGVVYRGHDPRLERAVAIKVLPEIMAEDVEILERFQREAKILASLSHPNVGAIYDLEELDGSHFLILEFVEGQTLAERLETSPMDPVEAASICGQIAAGVRAAHERGVVHRDIKPANVKLTPDGTVKVLDFGVAKTTSVAELPTTGPRWPTGLEVGESSGQIVGTPGFMSPEQIHGEPVDRRADIWAFGCVLYQCLTATECFRGRTAHDRLTATLDGSPDWERLPETTPQRLRDLLRRCLEKDPDRRLRDLGEALAELEAVAEQLRSAAARSPGPRHNLPRSLTSFVGRQREREQIAESLEGARLTTLTGVGGCGKTRLAVEVAGALLDRFADGVWLVELAPVNDPRLLTGAVGSALGILEESGRPLVETLCDVLRSRSSLLVLDNCEHLLGACAELADTLLRACPDLRILASSREALGVDGEQTHPVAPLDAPSSELPALLDDLRGNDSVRLFLDRASLVGPELDVTPGNAGAVAQICRRLDGIPLAIELAAAWMKVLTVEELATRLDDRFRLLRTGSRTALPRHQTLRATIDWSYDHLEEEEAALFRQLSVFAGGFTLEAAEAVCTGDGLGEAAILEILTHLYEKSLVLVEPPGGRYRLLETVREYAHDRLREAATVNAAYERHLSYFIALAERSTPHLNGPDQVVWLDRLDREHENLRAALAWCKKGGGTPDAALKLAANLWRFWERRAYWAEGRGHLNDVLAVDRAGAISADLASCLNGAGYLACRQGDFDAAQGLLERSLAMSRELGDDVRIATTLEHLGYLTMGRGDLDAARRHYEASLAQRREAGDTHGVARSLNNLGLLAEAAGEPERGRELLEESLELFRKHGDLWGITVGLNNLTVVANALGELDRARELCTEAIAISRRIGNRAAEAVNLENLSELVAHQGDRITARSLRTESLEVFRDLGDKAGIARNLAGFGMLSSDEGDLTRAARLFGAAEAYRAQVGLQLPPADAAELEQSVERTRRLLGAEAFTEACDAGRALDVAAAVSEALEERA